MFLKKKNKILVGIPARMSSTRYPGKPFCLIHGVPMIEHCYLRCQLSDNVDKVFLAICDEEIESFAKKKSKDKKTQLQEELQQRKVDLPIYKLNDENEESFNVICEVKELDLLSEGQGKNKKEAEQNAAANLLEKLINKNG